jgi:hypothetical protein
MLIDEELHDHAGFHQGQEARRRVIGKRCHTLPQRKQLVDFHPLQFQDKFLPFSFSPCLGSIRGALISPLIPFFLPGQHLIDG